MPIIAKKKEMEFSAAPEGLHQAVCCDVVDLGIVEIEWKGVKKMQHKIKIRWEIDEVDPKSPKGYRYQVSRRFTLSLDDKSALKPFLESWRGRKFTREETEGFDVEKLIGANCQIQVLHNIKSEGEVYANVQAVVPPSKATPKISVSGTYIRECDRQHRAELEANPEGYMPTDEDIPF